MFKEIMPVNSDEAQSLRNIRDFLEAEVQKEEKGNDVRGVYERVVEKLNGYVFREINIELNREGMSKSNRSSFKFTEEQIREIAKRKLARYCFYVLGEKNPENVPRKIKENLERLAQNKMDSRESLKRILSDFQYEHFLNNPLTDWYLSLDLVTTEVLEHYGTPLEEVE